MVELYPRGQNGSKTIWRSAFFYSAMLLKIQTAFSAILPIGIAYKRNIFGQKSEEATLW